MRVKRATHFALVMSALILHVTVVNFVPGTLAPIGALHVDLEALREPDLVRRRAPRGERRRSEEQRAASAARAVRSNIVAAPEERFLIVRQVVAGGAGHLEDEVYEPSAAWTTQLSCEYTSSNLPFTHFWAFEPLQSADFTFLLAFWKLNPLRSSWVSASWALIRPLPEFVSPVQEARRPWRSVHERELVDQESLLVLLSAALALNVPLSWYFETVNFAVHGPEMSLLAAGT